MNENQQLADTTFSDIIKPFTSRWYLFFISVFIFLLLGITYIYFNAPLYQVQAKVLIKEAKKSMAGGSEIANISGLSGLGTMPTNSIENELQVLSSKNIAEKIVNDLHLQVSQFKKSNRYDIELFGAQLPYKIYVINEKPFVKFPKKPIKVTQKGSKFILESKELNKKIETSLGQTVSLPYANIILVKNKNYNPVLVKDIAPLDEMYFNIVPKDVAVENLQKELKVLLVDEDGTVVQVEMIYANIAKAKEIINGVIKVYNTDAQADKNKDDQRSKDFIDGRLDIIANELGEVEGEKEKFKVANKIVDLPNQARIDMQTNLQANDRLLEMETKMQLNDMMLSYLNRSNYQLLPSSIGVENATAASILSSYNQLVAQRSKLLESATPKNPLVLELTNQIDDLNKALKESILKSRTALELSRNQIVKQENKSENNIDVFPKKERSYRGIERQQQIKENLYLMLLEKREEASIKLAMTAEKARVIDTAYNSLKAVAPKKIIILVSCIILGLIIPFLYIIIRKITDNRVTTKDDIEKLSTTSVISEIPRNKKGITELIKVNEISPSAEAFRILATNLKFILPKNDNASKILITSSVKGEGKTYIAINTALSLVSTSKKVLLIGADIRNPQLQRYNESMRNAAGLTEYLFGEEKDIKKIIHPSGLHKNCDYIYSGAIPPNPVELLSNGKFEELLNNLSQTYQYILIDAAPMMPVTDTSIIVEYTDAMLYVVRSEYSDKRFIDFFNNMKEQGKIINPVFVLNDLHQTNYGYGNTYGYGYQNDKKSLWDRIRTFTK